MSWRQAKPERDGLIALLFVAVLIGTTFAGLLFVIG